MYYRVIMKSIEDGTEYYAYCTARDKKEVSIEIREELLEDEKEDYIMAVILISKEEYESSYRRFGDGERSCEL